MTDDFDVVVVGGGAAGLGSAVALARSCRSVLVVDAGEPRNAPAHGVHNVLGREGTPPRELVAIGRAELEGYAGQVRSARVTGAERREDGIVLALDDGSTVRGRRVVLASGIVDVLPEVDGLAGRWGRDVVHCPFCHGYEVRGQRIGVLASSPMAVHQALLFSQLTGDLVVLVHDAELADADRARLGAAGATLVEGRVQEVVVEHDALSGVRLEDGRVMALQALAVQTRSQVRRELTDALGVPVVEHASGMGEHVPADELGRTGVPGVWAVGNLVEPNAQVMAAASSGTRVGAMVNMDLIETDLALTSPR